VALEEDEGGLHGGATRGGELRPVLLFMRWMLYRVVEEGGKKKEKDKRRKGRKRKKGKKKCGKFSMRKLKDNLCDWSKNYFLEKERNMPNYN
jgi:hypothetical protein